VEAFSSRGEEIITRAGGCYTRPTVLFEGDFYAHLQSGADGHQGRFEGVMSGPMQFRAIQQ